MRISKSIKIQGITESRLKSVDCRELVRVSKVCCVDLEILESWSSTSLIVPVLVDVNPDLLSSFSRE